MSLRIPTDCFGRPFISTQTLPSFAHEPSIDYSDTFIDAEGDQMVGNLDMGKNKITNIAHPTSKFDCANKAYVDELRNKTISTLKEKLDAKIAKNTKTA